jgi:hypothetical protein
VSGLQFPKPTPRAITKPQKAKLAELHRKSIKRQVFARDGGRCRVCGDAAQEMHELKFRSLLGTRSLENSIAVCAFGSRHGCHRLLQTHCIDVEGTDANGVLRFHWAAHIKPEERFFRIRSRRRSQQREA